jgi:hypothetical protein
MLARYSLLIAYFVSLQVLAQVDDEFRAIAAEPTTLNAVLRSSAQHFPLYRLHKRRSPNARETRWLLRVYLIREWTEGFILA